MKKTTRILIVEDTAADAELARHAIRKALGDCEFEVVATPKDFLQALGAFQPDVILSDYSLPHFNGLKALQLTLEHAPLTPLIIWTSSISEDVAVDCMKAGANNYVIKENLKRLGPAVIHALEQRETLIARRQAEEILRERERQLTMLFSNLPGPVYRCSNDPDYTVEFISDGITELSGYQAEDFREHRRHFGKMIHPDDRERIWGEIQTAVESNQPFELAYRILTATGEQKWVWEKGQGILDAAGQLQALEGFITDITERKEAEAKLAKSEERYHYLFENNPHPMWLYDRKTLAFLDVNEAAIAKYKYSRQEFLNMTIADIRPPEDRERLMESLTQRHSALERSEGWRHRLKDGTIINVEITSHVVEVDRRESVLVVAQDITERIQAEEALRASEIRFRTFVNHATDAFFLHDEDEQGRILDVNRQACESLGYSREELIGLTPLDFDLDLAPIALAQRRTQLDAGEALTFDTHHRRKDGTVFPVEVRMRSFKQGGRRFAISLVHDITGRKQAEARINDLLAFNEKILDHSPLGILTYKLTGECVYANESAASIVGTQVEQLQAQNFHTIESWKESGLYDLVEKTSKTKAPVTSDIHHVSTFGKDLWLTAHCVAFQSKGEDHVLLFISDVTERKRAEEALRESESRLVLALSRAQMSVWEWNLQTNQILWSPDFFELTGIGQNELGETFESFTNLIHSDDVERVMASAQKAMNEKTLFAEEFRIVRSNGEVHWLSNLGLTESDATGDHLRLIGTVQDITQRKQAESALMESMARFRTLFEASPDAILLLDPSNNWSIIDCNTAACQMNGYHREELIGQHIDILNATPADPDKWEEHLERIRQQGILRYEINHRRKDGSVFTVEVSNSLIHFGKRDIVLGIDRDITRRKQSEAETRRHMAELEALYENGLAVGRLLKPTEIGNRIIETFARYLSWHHVAIRLMREESDDLELVAFNLPTLKDEERSAAEQHFIARVNKIGHGLSGWAIQTGVPIRTGNVNAHPQYIRSHAGIQSGLYMPLKVGEHVIGVISVESETPNAFSEQDERLLATLANQAAIAFENARLYETIRKELAERGRAEEALRVSETHYRELANSITDILFELDGDLRCTHWNKASEVVTGIPVEKAIGKPIREIFGGTEERIGSEQTYKDVLRDHQPRTFETVIVLNGEKRSFEVNAYPSTRGMSVVAKDVTERKRSETIMQKRFELMEYSATHTLGELILRTVDEVSDLTGSAIGFFHFVEADQITLGTQVWSTNALQLHKVPIGEGKHLSLDQSGVWAEAARQRRSLIQNDYASLPESKGFPEGHVPVTREIVIPVIRNERMMAIIGIGNKPQDYSSYDLEMAERMADYAWDIIERKQMEVVLAEEHDQLAQRVEERTSDLSRANANLARALRVKDEFLANMSHELRTPLNAILGLSESLAEQIAGTLNEKQQKYINTISESGHHLLALINDILDLAKIESGQITLDINKVDIHSVCQASLRMIKQLAQKKNQEVFLKIDDGLGLMWADERRLKQMIVNLLSNAVKFTPENGRLGLEVHGDEAANKITITVWDNGIGIKDNDLMRLFRPFVQLDSGLAREAPGTGLGLALVAQMARLHGGSVGAVSEPEKGSRFSIILPWEPALAVDAATRLKITGKFRAIKPDQINRPTILLVEDTQEVTMMIKDYLELAGYKVVTAQDGVDALVQARLARPNLILMDVQMPRMDGLEATRRLRAEPDFKDTPIVALTALAMSSDRERCLAAGMDEYLSKPIHLKTLVKVIQGFLSNPEESQPR
ncbi:MAG TPA: PAS domain S-box protein [Anaerolineales bacterium]|nr:PAS domain S-box protein [Anaerolineales bacterium]